MGSIGVAGVVSAVAIAAVPASSQAAVVNPYATVGSGPWGIALDSAGNVYAANNTASSVSKVTPAGVVTTTSIGSGRFPVGVAVDAAGNAYAAGNAPAPGPGVYKVAPDRTVTELGTGGGSWGVTTDPAGNVYWTAPGAASGAFTGTVVGKIASSGVVSNPFANSGTRPEGITTDALGNVYTANNLANTVTKITPDGTAATLGTTGTGPEGIVVDSVGNVYTANVAGGSITKITPQGVSSTLATLPTSSTVRTVTIDSAGNLYTANGSANSVSRVTPDGTATTLASGLGAAARGIVLDGAGNLYVTLDSGKVVKITPDGATAGIAPAPPAIPSAPNATSGAQSATVSVTPNPVDARYGAPTAYTVTAVGDATKTCTITAPATSCTISGLKAGTSYAFTATAVLNTWTTASSAASNAITPLAASSAQASLTATMLAPRKRLVSGQRAELAIRITNAGTATASGATACVVVPSNVVITRAAGATRSKRNACFSIGDLAAGATSTRAVVVRVVSIRSVRRTVTGTIAATGLATSPATPVVLSIRPRALRPAVTG